MGEVSNTLLERLPFVGQLGQLVARVTEAAFVDRTTGLLTRNAFEEFAEQADNGGEAFGVVYFDLTGFKAINERHEHSGGDAALAFLGERVRGISQEFGVVPFRMGGDEFAVLIAPQSFDTFVEKGLSSLVWRDFSYNGDPAPFAASIGFASPMEGATVRGTLANAEQASKVSKGRRDLPIRWKEDMIVEKLDEVRRRCPDCQTSIVAHVAPSNRPATFLCDCPACGRPYLDSRTDPPV